MLNGSTGPGTGTSEARKKNRPRMGDVVGDNYHVCVYKTYTQIRN